jgi:uncharacterized protein YdaU (DUF1376 family)
MHNAKLAYFPFYVGDWLASQKRAQMTMAEQGLYFHLLCLQWVQEDCKLPGDVTMILRMLGTKSKKKVTKILQKCFYFDSICYRNERLYSEYLKAQILHERACKAAEKRWKDKKEEINKHNLSIDSSMPSSIANQNQNQNQKKIKHRANFVPPTLLEVEAYCKERQNKVNPDVWIDHYISNGWMVGKNKMKDWKAAVRTWEKNHFGDKEDDMRSAKDELYYALKDRSRTTMGHMSDSAKKLFLTFGLHWNVLQRRVLNGEDIFSPKQHTPDVKQLAGWDRE